jgi:AI-2 transport protein TqsA
MIPIPLNAASRIGLNVLLLLAGVLALHLGAPVIVPMLIALLLATVLGPAAFWLHDRLKIRWGLACIVVVVGLVLANLLILTVFSFSLVRLVNQLSDQEKMLKQYKEFRAKLAKNIPADYELDEVLLPKNPGSINEIGIFGAAVDQAPVIMREGARLTGNWTFELIVILVVTFFVLLEGQMLARRAAAIFGPSPEVQAKVTEVLLQMAEQVRNYLVSRTVINMGLALVMGTIYQALNLQQAWTWAILLLILNYIPYIGPILSCIPPFLDALIFADSLWPAIVVIVVFWVVVIIEGHLVVPMLMGRSMDLNATTVMLACLFWELVWPGMTGLFLAMPIMAGIKAILYNVPEWRPWAILMSSADHRDPEPPGAAAPNDDDPESPGNPVLAEPSSPGGSPNGHARPGGAKATTAERT